MFFKKTNKINFSKYSSPGFTLMEIVVATTIFVIVFMSLLSLFNYTLKINRRAEALRQATQGMRNFVEYLVKELRNGQLDYYVVNGDTYIPSISNTSPCRPPLNPGNAVTGVATYGVPTNWLGVINTDGVQECFYYGNKDGNYVETIGNTPSVFSYANGGTLVLQKAGVSGSYVLNPSNFKIDSLMFVVKPVKDPYTSAGGYVKVSPGVAIFIKFIAKLATGEQVAINYQTSVAVNQYDIPSQ